MTQIPPYLETRSTAIVTASGREVRWRAINWYGFESNDYTVTGLDRRPYIAILRTVRTLGYNALRLPFSNEMVEQNPVVSALRTTCPAAERRTACLRVDGRRILAANMSLWGLHALTIYKRIADAAHDLGLYVIADDHRSAAGWGPQDNGLWYDKARGFPERSWYRDWLRMIELFRGDPALTAVDLFNEPSSEGYPSNCHTYEYGHGSAWGACGGVDNPATDWRAAATRCGNMTLHHNPHLLIVVEGTSIAPDRHALVVSHGAASNLAAVARQPVVLQVPHHLIYEIHAYRWIDGDRAQSVLRQRWQHLFGYVLNARASYAAPLWIGEMGTCMIHVTCITASQPGRDGYWFTALIHFINSPPSPDTAPINWGLWALNSTYPDAYDFGRHVWVKCGVAELYGVLDPGYCHLRLSELARVHFAMTEAGSERTGP